jgi:hypothetical protein
MGRLRRCFVAFALAPALLLAPLPAHPQSPKLEALYVVLSLACD